MQIFSNFQLEIFNNVAAAIGDSTRAGGNVSVCQGDKIDCTGIVGMGLKLVDNFA